MVLPAYAAWLWADAVGATPDPDVAHPSVAHMVGLEGTGLSIQDVFDLMDASADSGVVLGETDFELRGTLTPGATYDCEAEVLAVDRKRGARAGVFDRLRFVVRVRDGAAEEPVATCTYTMIFPRAEA